MVSTSWPGEVATGQQWIRSSGQLAISEQNEQLITKNFLVDLTDFYFYLSCPTNYSMDEIVWREICSRGVFYRKSFSEKFSKRKCLTLPPSPASTVSLMFSALAPSQLLMTAGDCWIISRSFHWAPRIAVYKWGRQAGSSQDRIGRNIFMLNWADISTSISAQFCQNFISQSCLPHIIGKF